VAVHRHSLAGSERLDRRSAGIAAADELQRDPPVDERAHAIGEYYAASEKEFPLYLKGKGFGTDEIGTHAGLADTSLALAVDPALVRAERLKDRARGKAEGVYGDPTRATAELGRAGLDLIVERTIAAIRMATARK